MPANVAEGWGRGSTGEYIQFLLIARGSLMETETHLIIAQELNYIEAERLAVLQEQVQGIGQMLNRLVHVLKDSRNPNPESRTPKQ